MSINRFEPFDPDDVDERDELDCEDARLEQHLDELIREKLYEKVVDGASGGRMHGPIRAMRAAGDTNRKIAEALFRLRDAA